jgi:hypothetical protein
VSATLCRRVLQEVGLACLAGLAFYAAGSCSLRRTPVFLFYMPEVNPRVAAEVTAAEGARLGREWFDATEEAAWRTLLAV